MNRKTPGDIAFDVINGIILTLYMIVLLYPLLNTVAISFNDGTDALRGGIYLWPRMFTWKNYITVLQKSTMITAAKVTVARTVIGTLSSTLVTSLLAYVLSRREFLFRRQLSLLYVITMYVNGGLVPILLLYKNLHLTNSFWVYIIPGMVSAFNMLVMRTYINGIPASLSESAEIDGAGHMTIFFKIILPLCMPVIATISLFTAVYQWNSWFDAMLYNRMSDNLTTLQYELMKLLNSVTNNNATAETMKNSTGQVTPASIRAAATVVTSLPILCLYPFLQRYFVAGLTIGGVKE
ncbi:MAG: carbohydrate ABC transporter permease [Oscillospiraceae bacterium]|nr:carbohydrate ABC transporter permease [Oscillospiraceae bacterium]